MWTEFGHCCCSVYTRGNIEIKALTQIAWSSDSNTCANFDALRVAQVISAISTFYL